MIEELDEKEMGGSTIYRYWESIHGSPDPIGACTSLAILRDCETSCIHHFRGDYS